MEEKILVKSQRYNIKKLCLWIMGISVVAIVIYLIYECSQTWNWCIERYNDGYCYYCKYELYCRVHDKYSSAVAYANAIMAAELSDYLLIMAVLIVPALICALIYAWMHSYEIVITDKRVYGKTAWGRRVDLPIDSVSAVGSKAPKGISVSTSSGKVSFLLIKNRNEIHKCVSDLLIERQSKRPSEPVVMQAASQSNADELKKYKELLDSGVISQEEFDAKKKQILGL